MAYQALYDIGHIKEGQNVLINGGGGGVGTFSLQLAKLHHCYITGVDSAAKPNLMKSLGFDEVFDYRKLNFTKTGDRYDLILDCKTNHSALAYARALKPRGTHVSIGGQPLKLIGLLL